jgi:hypothetical protein
VNIRKLNQRLFVGVSVLALLVVAMPVDAALTFHASYDANFDEEVQTVPIATKAHWGNAAFDAIPIRGAGKFGDALLSGTAGNGEVLVAYTGDIQPAVTANTAGTMEVWVNPVDINGTFPMIMGTASNGLWSPGIQLYMDPSNHIQAHLLDSVGATRDWLEPTTAVSVVTPGQWNHAALVWNAAEIRLYLNGSLVSSQARDTGNWLDPDNVFWVAGIVPNSPSKGLHAGVDDVAVWDEERYTGTTYDVPTAAIPEPASLLLLASGGLLLKRRRRS